MEAKKNKSPDPPETESPPAGQTPTTAHAFRMTLVVQGNKLPQITSRVQIFPCRGGSIYSLPRWDNICSSSGIWNNTTTSDIRFPVVIVIVVFKGVSKSSSKKSYIFENPKTLQRIDFVFFRRGVSVFLTA